MNSGNDLVCTGTAVTPSPEANFDLSSFRIFTTVPDHSDLGIATLNGMVVIYDERPLHQEGIVEGGFYVRESQRPRNGMTWESWLRWEWDDRQPRVGPAGPLAIRRDVVQAIRWPNAESWSVRLSSGHVCGPYHDWAFGRDMIGKVVGIYLPAQPAEELSV